MFDRALQIDPNDPLAVAGSAETYLIDYGFGWRDPGTDYEAKVLGPANRAIVLNPENIPAYYTKAMYLAETGRPGEALDVTDVGLAINPNYVPWAHTYLVAALALTGHDAEAREALKRYLALPSAGPLKTVAAFEAYFSAQGGAPPEVEAHERIYDGLRKAGMPEE